MKDDARHRQFIPRAATLALVGSFGLFGLLAVAVAAGLLQGFDVSAATAIQRLRYSTTDRLLLALTMTGDGWVMTRATLLAVAVLLWQRQWRLALAFGLTMLAVATLVPAIKAWLAVPRPYDFFYAGRQLYSFPSNHAAGAATFWSLTALLLAASQARAARIGIALAAAAFIAATAFSRVQLGAHWPSDVLGGVLFGLGLTTLFWLATQRARATLRPSAAVLIVLGWLAIGSWHVASRYATSELFYGREAVSQHPQKAP